MKKLVCINCPNGCELNINEETLEVSGNLCPRGKDFALSELKNPQRTICSTVKTSFKDTPLVPVRVNKPIPKNMIFEVMKKINDVTVTRRLQIGDIVIKNVCYLDADVIITSNILKENHYEK